MTLGDTDTMVRERTHRRIMQRETHLSAMPGERLTTTQNNLLSSVNLPRTRADYIAQVKVDIQRERRGKHEMTARWMEILLDLAVKHPQGADVWVGFRPCTLTQILKSRFKSSSNYSSGLMTLSENALVFFRKALKVMIRH